VARSQRRLPAPIFFMSYAQSKGIAMSAHGPREADQKVLRFFDDLSAHVSELIGARTGEYPGFIDRSLDGGQRWNSEILRAAGTCHVFVALVSPGYVRSDFCATEWRVFANRPCALRESKAATRGNTAILPVTWLPVRMAELPPEVGAVHRFIPSRLRDPDIAKRYDVEGVYGLLSMNDEAAYQTVTWRLAVKVVNTFHTYEVTPCLAEDADGPDCGSAGGRP
jgi:TIR domain